MHSYIYNMLYYF